MPSRKDFLSNPYLEAIACSSNNPVINLLYIILNTNLTTKGGFTAPNINRN
ncbi:hypothetical protein IQ227_04395 [Anabaena aphanizomenioides LEGE 00250]|uniref:Uncharacterized protein n=1 Tax=Sphaerospermopsis aphanizomenoides LEGE 00250 TaxID=2777972 RepID=A0ABR9V9Y6_9CYAN|nr:hypothetical protein [Sphaerospermopsis aphanizomenoides]MBE9235299.1 hypothetical protein [Sphaerospermopsis aphanizomenoides LEGE 00250]